MKKEQYEWLFWTTIVIAFVLLEHNSTGPLFLVAFSLLPVLIVLFLYNRSFYPIALYLLIFGALARYDQYLSANYASDALPSIRDFIGYFLAGKNIYGNNVMTATGSTPFNYLPFAIFWYLPARLFTLDLRFFEMIVSSLVPAVFLLIGFITSKWKALPFLAIISLSPFLIDLSSDGSNDNSAIFILLVSIFFLIYSVKKKSKNAVVASAVVLGFSLAFKQYAFFYLLFFLPFILKIKKNLEITPRRYILIAFFVFGIFSLPFILSSPQGFYQSVVFVGGDNTHKVWGWNIWGALKAVAISIPIRSILYIRSCITIATIILLFRFYSLSSLSRVVTSSSLTFLVFLVFSNWTTNAYFTFIIPLFCLIPLCSEINFKK